MTLLHQKYIAVGVRPFLIPLLIIISIYLPQNSFSQTVLNTPITGTFDNLTVIEFLEILENRMDIRIYYDPGKIPFYRHSYVFEKEPLYQAMDKFLRGSTLDLIKYQDHLLIAEKSHITAEIIEELLSKWEDGTFEKPLISDAEVMPVIFGDSLQPDLGTVTLKGKIVDKYTGDPIIGAVLKDQESDNGTTTDENGVYELMAAPGRYLIDVSYLGYQNIELHIGWYTSGSLNLDMEVFALNLSEVVVEASATQDKVSETQIGIEMISTREIRELPSLLGEADVLKSIERLPGVNTVSEASAGFNVRGGNIDQNLILLDDAILFNASHALGFFSIFNPDAVRNVTLHKGNIPARYGGRLSSVLNVDLKDGKMTQWHGGGAISLASARFTAEGPVSDKTSLVLGARSSYSNWLLSLFKNPNIRNSRFYFNDFVAKVSHRLSEKNFLSLTGYSSNDNFRFSDEFGYEWATRLASLKWRYLINSEVSISSNFSVGKYQSVQFIPTGDLASDLQNGIGYQKLSSNLSYQTESHFINLGLEGISYQMDPEVITPRNSSSDIASEEVRKNKALELALYANDELKLSNFISISYGLRLGHFISLGPSELRSYDPEKPKSEASVLTSKTIGNNKKESSYTTLEPRISANIKLGADKSVKLSYNRVNQFLHLISNTVNPTPVDVWQLTNSYFKPEIGNNYSLGFFQNINESWNYSVEGFYKSIDQFPQFKDFAELQLNDFIETQLILGNARSYGVEFGLERKTGNLTGTIAYTYSRSEVQTTGTFQEEIINSNDWYPVHFDQPHQLNFQLQWNIDPIQKLYVGFTYKSGRPITVPIASYPVQDVLITHYSDRNQFRVPYFQRIDFGYTIDRSQAKLKGLKSTFALSLINLLGRSNPYTIYFRRDNLNIQRSYKLSILGTLFPSLNWNFHF